MSGHSKWSTIKRKKGAADAKRGAVFTKYSKAIALAARDGDDPESNYKLRLAIDKARLINMPVSNIARAIERGSGKGKDSQLSEVIYEGYGPGGVAIMVSCATDNTNRTSAEVRSTFTKSGGNLAEPGAVAYQFKLRGLLHITTEDVDGVSLQAIDSGAEDVEPAGGEVIVYTTPKSLMVVKIALEQEGSKVDSAELSYEPSQTVAIGDKEVASKILRLVDNLDELEDVVAVFGNFDISEQMLSELMT